MSGEYSGEDSQWSTPYSTVPPSSSSDVDPTYLSQPASQASGDFSNLTTSYSDSEFCGRCERVGCRCEQGLYSFSPAEFYDPSSSWVNQETTSQGPVPLPSIAVNGMPANDSTYYSHDPDPRPLRPPAVYGSSAGEAAFTDTNQDNLISSSNQAISYTQSTAYGNNIYSEPWSLYNRRTDPYPETYAGNPTLPYGNVLAGDDLTSTWEGSENGSSYQIDASHLQLTSAEIKDQFQAGRCLLDGCRSKSTFNDYRAYIGHVRRVHVRGFYCTVEGCSLDKPFAKKGDLKRHFISRHNLSKDFVCTRSSCTQKIKAWARKDKLREHDKKYHWNHKCIICSQSLGFERWFDTRQELEEHTNRRHNPY